MARRAGFFEHVADDRELGHRARAVGADRAGDVLGNGAGMGDLAEAADQALQRRIVAIMACRLDLRSRLPETY